MQQERAPARAVDPALYTYEDLLEMPEDRYRHELLDGELVLTPAPSLDHQDVVANLYRYLEAHVRKHSLGRVYFAPVDVFLGRTTVLEPDLVFVTEEQLAGKGRARIEGAPGLVVEVVSKGTRGRDRGPKKAAYQRHGVAHYWILDPFTKTLEELVLERKRYALRTTLTGAKRFEPACFPGLKVSLGKVWV